MGIKDLLKKILGNEDNNRKFYPDYTDDSIIKIYLKENENIVLIDDEVNDEVFVLTSVTNLSVADKKDHLYVSYENLYELYYSEDKSFCDDYKVFNLPQIYSGFISIDNKGNYNENEIVKYSFGFNDGASYDIKKFKNNILIVDGEYQVIPKEMYEFLKKIIEYNKNGEKNTKIEEQIGFLAPIKEYAKKTNVILSKRLEEEEKPIVIDKIKLDFLKKDNCLEIVPYIEEKDEDFNKEFLRKFDGNSEIKNFYSVNDKGKNRKVIFKNKDSVEKVKRNRVLTGQKEFEFYKGENEIFQDENFDLSLYGPRVIGFGYLTYRANMSIESQNDESWFDTDNVEQLPRFSTNEESFILRPEHKKVFQDKLIELEREDKEIGDVSFKYDGKIYKIPVTKEQIKNEIEKIDNAIVDIDKINSTKKLEDIKHKMKDSPEEKYIEFKGRYIKNYGSEYVQERIEKVKRIKADKREKKREKELVISDNLNDLEYTEGVEGVTEAKKYKLEVPKNLKVKLYPHQKEGVSKLQNLYRNSKVNGFLLADDMGLGATRYTISFCA